MPIPPLLPLPNAVARYESIKGRVWNAPESVLLVDPDRATQNPGAYAQLFAPTAYNLCGHEQPPLLLLTSLWSDGQSPILTHANITRYVTQALQNAPGWTDMLDRNQPRLAVVIIPTATTDRVYERVAAYEYDAPVLFSLANQPKDLGAWAHRNHVNQLLNVPAEEYQVPAADVAACLGWSALPCWPEGTATESTCSRWHPETPVDIAVPASMARNLEIGRWIAHRSGVDAADSDNLTALAALFDPVTRAQASEHKWNPDLPHGLQVAVRITWPDPMPKGSRTASPWTALDRLYADPATPPAIAADMHTWLGDPRYASSARLMFTDLPEPWTRLFAAAAENPSTDDDTPRIRRLRAAAGDYTPEALSVSTFGPLSTPAVLSTKEIVWLPPAGFSPEHPADAHPALAIPDDPHDPPFEVLFIRSEGTGLVAGWCRTLAGKLAPLPAKSQWGTGDEWNALILTAALEDLSLQQIQDAQNRRFAAALAGDYTNPEDLPMLRQIRQVPDRPIVVPWDDLKVAARQSWRMLDRPALQG